MSPRKTKNKTSTLRRGHRWLGLALLAPLLLLSVTGVLLNHAHALRLDRLFLTADWLLNAYGIDPQPPRRGYDAGGQWISHAHGLLFRDGERLDEVAGAPVGAAVAAGLLAIAGPAAVLLYTRDGRSVDRLPAPARIMGLCLVSGRVVIQTARGNYRADPALTRWQPYPGACAAEQPAPLPTDVRAAIGAKLGNSILTWETLLLDLHSGRLLGRLGPWLLDAAGLLVCALAVTGLWVWLRHAFGRRSSGTGPVDK